ncbi:hypothetical protein ACFRCW_08575 [Streptomyces sp. NPDC056653]|uniref:hypothetical protein n=1 Tax=Streptomyces sp. NPDC056653 TaxID=3345894 RepID=UPI00368EF9BE
MTGQRPGSICRRQGDLRRGWPGCAVPAAPLVVAVGSGCASESGDRAERRAARSSAGGPGAPAGRAGPPGDLPAPAAPAGKLDLDLEWRERDRGLRPGDIVLTRFGGATDWDGSGSRAAVIRAAMKTVTTVMKTIMDKGYAVARPGDYV